MNRFKKIGKIFIKKVLFNFKIINLNKLNFFFSFLKIKNINFYEYELTLH
jgi:hypothetical protein